MPSNPPIKPPVYTPKPGMYQIIVDGVPHNVPIHGADNKKPQ